MKCLATVFVLVIASWSIAQDTAILTSEAQRAVDKFDTSVEAAKKTYDATVAKAREQAIKDLQAAMKEEAKKGNLESALSIKAKMETLGTSAPTTELVPAREPKGNHRFVATWTLTNPAGKTTMLELKANGEILHSRKGQWEIKGESLVLHHSQGGYVDTFKVGGDPNILVGSNKDGGKVVLEREKN